MSTVLSFVVALAGLQTVTFGFTISPQAAHILLIRILAIRVVGVGLAVMLLLMVATTQIQTTSM